MLSLEVLFHCCIVGNSHHFIGGRLNTKWRLSILEPKYFSELFRFPWKISMKVRSYVFCFDQQPFCIIRLQVRAAILWDFLKWAEKDKWYTSLLFNTICLKRWRICHVSTILHTTSRVHVTFASFIFEVGVKFPKLDCLRTHYDTVYVSTGHQRPSWSHNQNKFLIQAKLELAWDQSLSSLSVT